MSAFHAVQLKEVVRAVESWNPLKAGADETFHYIDLSAVDQGSKRIIGAREISCRDAPSRARQLVEQDDVLVSTVRPNLNGVAIIPSELHEATASTGFCVVRPDQKKLAPNYLFHWVKTDAFVSAMVRQATGASYPAVSDKIVLSSSIPLPSLPEQHRIAGILDKADALRIKRRETLVQLDNLAQSIFVEMFGDPKINPYSWPVQSLGDLTQKITDGEHINPEFSAKGMPIVMAGNVLEDSIDLHNTKRVPLASGEKFRRKCNPETGDLLVVSRGATIGRMCSVTMPDEFCLMGSVVLIKLNRSLLLTEFVSGLLKHPVMRALLYKTSGSSAQQAIYLKDLKNLACIVPPIELQMKFGERIRAISAAASKCKSALQEAENLFLSLQHRAFRGQLL